MRDDHTLIKVPSTNHLFTLFLDDANDHRLLSLTITSLSTASSCIALKKFFGNIVANNENIHAAIEFCIGDIAAIMDLHWLNFIKLFGDTIEIDI